MAFFFLVSIGVTATRAPPAGALRRCLFRLFDQTTKTVSARLESALTKITYGLSLSPDPPHGARTLFIADPAWAKKECQDLLCNKEEYDLDKDGVLNERELESAMEKEAKNTWMKINALFATHPPTYKRILLLREIDSEIESGGFTSDRVYKHI